jgi:hypothetical protein
MAVGGMVGEMVVGEMVGLGVTAMAVGGLVSVGRVVVSTDAHPVNKTRKTTWK